MRPWRRVCHSALIGWGIVLATAVPAFAQEYENARQSIGISPDPIARSPGLLGMGRLTLVGDDRHNRITLWDFAGNPAGIHESDSTSSFEVRPGTASASGVADVFSQGSFQRQTLAARGTGTAFEAWRRLGSVVYGLAGDLNALRVDQPYASDIELRQHYSNPRVMAALSGTMPYTESGRLRYALTLVTGQEQREDEFRTLVSNAVGEYIDRDGEMLTPPNLFTPTSSSTTTIGGGATVSYRFGSWLDAAVIGDLVKDEVYATSSAGRYSSEIREQLRGRRPYPAGQATFIGHVGPHLAWGWDGRVWDARYEQNWVFTISAGIGQNPLTGRGALADREARGSRMRSRVLWTQGPFEIGGSLVTGFSSSVIDPPPASDPTSLNKFLYVIYNRPNADSLALPDSVMHQGADRAAAARPPRAARRRVPQVAGRAAAGSRRSGPATGGLGRAHRARVSLHRGADRPCRLHLPVDGSRRADEEQRDRRPHRDVRPERPAGGLHLELRCRLRDRVVAGRLRRPGRAAREPPAVAEPGALDVLIRGPRETLDLGSAPGNKKA